jgi:hypothetical protein
MGLPSMPAAMDGDVGIKSTLDPKRRALDAFDGKAAPKECSERSPVFPLLLGKK